MVRHEAVRDYCEALDVGSTRKFQQNERDRVLAYKQRRALRRANGEEIPVKTAIVERGQSRNSFERHDAQSARGMPQADLKVGLYDRKVGLSIGRSASTIGEVGLQASQR